MKNTLCSLLKLSSCALSPFKPAQWKMFDSSPCKVLILDVSWGAHVWVLSCGLRSWGLSWGAHSIVVLSPKTATPYTAALYFDRSPDDIAASDIDWLSGIYKAVQSKLKKIPFVVSEGGKKMLLTYCGYNAFGYIDEKNDLIKGKVIDVNDSITFEGESVQQFKQAFHDAIDSYLEFCEAENREPDKPFSGKISYRTTQERHRDLTIAAAQAGISVNALMDQIIGRTINQNNGNFQSFSSYAIN
ncbi:type II toxin-antitoxin system HicB family antitoxin [Leptothoe sp. PORK10 BA2]|uniref:type II toxin-antitoxin system HicB family antitoxin n=1 Tax=Leptothoe sp. PORK10 BA2 TaxID=3110254 RepID=UPI002B20D677|nr:type II toxin-antitoxin system HicB family antitoxin [Leptothoe sp. PORK10 BA2]MEA5464526.1 type II toxin-antitoxin system HicB family antitoxin [Leptothoe sp. PORK10 BA2]